nr:EOG090X0AVC [Sida crystallina]
MMEFEDLDDIFGKMDGSDQSHDEEEDEDNPKRSKKKTRDDEAEEVNEDGDGDEKENDKAKKKKKATGVKRTTNPRPKLDYDRICGPRGILALQDTFKDVQLKGKGHEKSDLDLILKKMEHWAHRLNPNLTFGECLSGIEKLGHNKKVQTYIKKIRMDMIDVVNTDETRLSDDERRQEPDPEPERDAFDDLLAHYSKPATPAAPSLNLTIEQQERIAENKRKAEEKRKSRLLASDSSTTSAAGQCETSRETCKPNESAAEAEELMDIDAMLADMPQE